MQRLTGFLPEDLSLVPNIHVRWLITACNSNTRGLNALSGFCSCMPPFPNSHYYYFFFLRDLSLNAKEDVSDGQ